MSTWTYERIKRLYVSAQTHYKYG